METIDRMVGDNEIQRINFDGEIRFIEAEHALTLQQQRGTLEEQRQEAARFRLKLAKEDKKNQFDMNQKVHESILEHTKIEKENISAAVAQENRNEDHKKSLAEGDR